jgi:two-component system response regulator BaeR
MSEKILIVEDEVKLANLLSEYLMASGFQSFAMVNGTEVVAWIREHKPALVLLDLMLPGCNGMDICREVRTFSQVPVIMVTAKVEEIDRLLGLELGADDYICKPFSPREVIARVKAVLRRAHNGKTIQAQELVLDEYQYRAMLHGHDLSLTAVEFKLLQVLAVNPGRIFGRQQLMEKIYPDDRFVSDRTIDGHIKKLRRKLEFIDPGTKLIHSVYGVGYKFEIEE